jgi:putative aldouronate transport system substrate-binding protein
MRKTLAFLLALIFIACTAAAACAEITASEWGFPISSEPIYVTAMGLQSPQGGDHNDMIAWTKYAEMSNIHITWENVPTASAAERLSVVIASGDIPDMIWACGINSSDLVKYGSTGLFLNLDENFSKYAYNFQKVIEQYPAIRSAITMGDGHIYAFPQLIIGDNMLTNKIYINPDWLARVGLAMPANFEEFNKVLYAFRDQDANGNGDPNDEIPFILRYTDAHFLPSLYTFFGLGNRGTKHLYVDWDNAANGLRFIPTSKEFRDLLTWAHTLYADGLLDKEVFENTSSRQIVAKTSADLVGVHSDFVTNTGSVMQDIFRAIPVMENFYGNKEYTRRSAMVNNGAFVVSAKSKYAKELTQWCDYWYSEPGQLMWNMGVEGVTYVTNPDGTVRFTDEMIKNPEGLTLTQVRVKYMGFQGGAGIQSDTYYQGAETYWTARELMDQYKPYLPVEVWESFNPTFDESEEMSFYWTDIQAYIKENIAAFIVGNRSLDEWDAYVAEFDKMGLQEYMAIYQTQYERYKGL